MLAKQFRLPAAVRLTSSRNFSTDTFFLKVSNNNLPYSRFGFVVRKAVDKRATTRNRIRRVFRSCIEELFDKIPPGRDMLFLLKAPLLEMKRQDLYNTLYVFLKDRQLLQ